MPSASTEAVRTVSESNRRNYGGASRGQAREVPELWIVDVQVTFPQDRRTRYVRKSWLPCAHLFTRHLCQLRGVGVAGRSILSDAYCRRRRFLSRSISRHRSDAREPSIETGFTAHQVIGTRQSPGAAGTVTNNLSSLEAGEIFAVGVIGDDGHGYILRRELEKRGVQTEPIPSPYRFTPTYTKPMFLRETGEVEGERIDIINRTQTPPELEEEIIRQIEGVIPESTPSSCSTR